MLNKIKESIKHVLKPYFSPQALPFAASVYFPLPCRLFPICHIYFGLEPEEFVNAWNDKNHIIG